MHLGSFLWVTINRRSSDLFPIGPPMSTLLPLITQGVYKFIDSISQIALGGFVLFQQLL